jgi:hypothetical protein
MDQPAGGAAAGGEVGALRQQLQQAQQQAWRAQDALAQALTSMPAATCASALGETGRRNLHVERIVSWEHPEARRAHWRST